MMLWSAVSDNDDFTKMIDCHTAGTEAILFLYISFRTVTL